MKPNAAVEPRHLEKAAQAWCDPFTQHLPIQPEVFRVFAQILANAERDITVKQAIDRISAALKAESGRGSYRDLWLENIAMPILDYPRLDLRSPEGANKMAEILLKHFFDA
ncbi:MAG: hypothetical protein U1E51_26315 [Candidatus Binatia bacterium]|nr:hypothetical protein [Candidatus Binatia bacterium]